jgi:hypothetical protein
MEYRIVRVWIQNEEIFIETNGGVRRSRPLRWFPKLLNATVEERGNFELSPFGIHWRQLDEDLSFEGFFYLQ